MQFTHLPAPFAALGQSVGYTVTHPIQTDIDLRIRRADDSAPLAAARFYAVTEATLDVAAILRPVLSFEPESGTTGLYAGRSIEIVVEAENADGQIITAPNRTLLPFAQAVSAPALLSVQSANRLISAGESDELTLLTNAAGTVTVTAQTGESLIAESYPIPSAGLWTFRLSVDDFGGAESLTVDAGVCGAVVYTVIPRPTDAVRLAWRSGCGSIERYTFPRVVRQELTAEKRRIDHGVEQRVASASNRRTMTLRSAYELSERAVVIAEVIASPEVWIATGEGYRRVEVITEQAVFQRIGELCALEIEIQETLKTATPWN